MSSARGKRGRRRLRCWCARPRCRRASCRHRPRPGTLGARCLRVTRSPRRHCGRPNGWRACWDAGTICRRSIRISRANAIPPISPELPTCCRGRPGFFRARSPIAAPRFAPGAACSTWTSATRGRVPRLLQRWRLSIPIPGTSRVWSTCYEPGVGGPRTIASRPCLVCASLT